MADLIGLPTTSIPKATHYTRKLSFRKLSLHHLVPHTYTSTDNETDGFRLWRADIICDLLCQVVQSFDQAESLSIISPCWEDWGTIRQEKIIKHLCAISPILHKLEFRNVQLRQPYDLLRIFSTYPALSSVTLNLVTFQPQHTSLLSSPSSASFRRLSNIDSSSTFGLMISDMTLLTWPIHLKNLYLDSTRTDAILIMDLLRSHAAAVEISELTVAARLPQSGQEVLDALLIRIGGTLNCLTLTCVNYATFTAVFGQFMSSVESG